MCMSSKACGKMMLSGNGQHSQSFGTEHGTHQSSTAQENHEDDEGFKPVVLHNSETSSTQVPPFLAFALGNVYSQTRPAPHAVSEGERFSISTKKTISAIKISNNNRRDMFTAHGHLMLF